MASIQAQDPPTLAQSAMPEEWRFDSCLEVLSDPDTGAERAADNNSAEWIIPMRVTREANAVGFSIRDGLFSYRLEGDLSQREGKIFVEGLARTEGTAGLESSAGGKPAWITYEEQTGPQGKRAVISEHQYIGRGDGYPEGAPYGPIIIFHKYSNDGQAVRIMARRLEDGSFLYKVRLTCGQGFGYQAGVRSKEQTDDLRGLKFDELRDATEKFWKETGLDRREAPKP
jgi:hypothetical protein